MLSGLKLLQKMTIQISLGSSKMLSSGQKVQECDATKLIVVMQLGSKNLCDN